MLSFERKRTGEADGFAANLRVLCERAGEKAENVVRLAALELERDMVIRTPVDTGRAKGAWHCGVGSIDTSDSGRLDNTPKGQADEGGALAAAEAKLKTWKPGQVIWVSLSLPYAKRMENGWSQQAPSGMVRLSVHQYSEHIRKAVEASR